MFWNPDTEGIHALSHYWAEENDGHCWIEIPNTVDGFEEGNAPYYTMFGDKDLRFKTFALKVNFEGHPKDYSVRLLRYEGKLVCR